MPIPLRPNQQEHNTPGNISGYFSLNPSHLSDFINLSVPDMMSKEAAASDADASLVYSLWEKSAVASEADKISERVYEIPEDFNQDDVLRLKTFGFLVKRDVGVSFTEKAEHVIQTMVLAEQNKFGKNSVKKPYSVILAESKIPKRSSNLSLTASVNHLPKNDVMIMSGLVTFSKKTSGNDDYVHFSQPYLAPLTSSSTYIYNGRLINTKEGHHKEYNVRVYDNGDGTYDVWAFNGKINGTMVSQPKGRYNSKTIALDKAKEVMGSKLGRGYVSAEQGGYPKVNESISGTSESSKKPTSKTEKTKTKSPIKLSPKDKSDFIAKKEERDRRIKEELERKKTEQEDQKAIEEIVGSIMEQGELEE